MSIVILVITCQTWDGLTITNASSSAPEGWEERGNRRIPTGMLYGVWSGMSV